MASIAMKTTMMPMQMYMVVVVVVLVACFVQGRRNHVNLQP